MSRENVEGGGYGFFEAVRDPGLVDHRQKRYLQNMLGFGRFLLFSCGFGILV
jgi:hypothetical protein